MGRISSRNYNTAITPDEMQAYRERREAERLAHENALALLRAIAERIPCEDRRTPPSV